MEQQQDQPQQQAEGQVQQQAEDQHQQQAEQLQRHRETIRPDETACVICGRDGFRGSTGILIHLRKNEACRLLQPEFFARQALALGAESDNGGEQPAQEGEEEGIDAEAREAQQEAAAVQFYNGQRARFAFRVTVPFRATWAVFTQLLRLILRFISHIVRGFWYFTQGFFKFMYSLMFLFFGLSNIYFLYLYLSGTIPATNKTTFLLSPNFENEFRVM